jgi:hypothetical protein
VIEPVEGQEHNKTARVRRKEAIDDIDLSMRQKQAAQRIRNAYCKKLSTTSGGPMTDFVDASPKPDAVIVAQIEAQDALDFAMSAVPKAARGIVEHVCWHNGSIRSYGGMRATNSANFKIAMDLVANKCRY